MMLRLHHHLSASASTSLRFIPITSAFAIVRSSSSFCLLHPASAASAACAIHTQCCSNNDAPNSSSSSTSKYYSKQTTRVQTNQDQPITDAVAMSHWLDVRLTQLQSISDASLNHLILTLYHNEYTASNSNEISSDSTFAKSFYRVLDEIDARLSNSTTKVANAPGWSPVQQLASFEFLLRLLATLTQNSSTLKGKSPPRVNRLADLLAYGHEKNSVALLRVRWGSNNDKWIVKGWQQIQCGIADEAKVVQFRDEMMAVCTPIIIDRVMSILDKHSRLAIRVMTTAVSPELISSNVIRLLKLLHSIRHLYSNGRLISVYLKLLLCGEDAHISQTGVRARITTHSRNAPLRDFISLVQLAAFYRDCIPGLNHIGRYIRKYFSTNLDSILMEASFLDIIRIIEVCGILELSQTDESLLRLMNRAADLSKLPSYESLKDQPELQMDKQMLSVVRQLDGGKFLQLDIASYLTLAFRSYTECSTPRASDGSRWLRWLWMQDLSGRGPEHETRAQEFTSALRIGQVLASYYTHQLANTTTFRSIPQRHAFTEPLYSFAWCLIVLEMERYEWCIRFLRHLIPWFEAQHSIVDADRQLVTTTGQHSVLVYKENKMPEKRTWVSRLMHQISIALFLRLQTIDCVQSESASVSTSPSSLSSSLPMSTSDSTLNFSSPFRDYFQFLFNLNAVVRISQFQLMIYKMLSDESGEYFGWKQRVLHEKYELRKNDPLVEELLNMSGEEVKLESTPSASSTAVDGEKEDKKIEFFVEHSTSVGYVVDAAVFNHRIVKSNESASDSLLNRSEIAAASPLPSYRDELISIAIEIDGPNHYRKVNTHEWTCRTRLRKKQLELCGWQLVNIDCHEWNKRSEGKEREEWIAQMFPRRLLQKTPPREAR